MRKSFCLRDNCISIGIVKLSLLRTGYFSSAANVLTSSPKIWHVNKRDFFQLHWFGSDEWIWLRWSLTYLNSAWARLPFCLSKDPLKRDFLDVYLTTFSESVISEIHNLWGSCFCSKRSKFQLDFKKATKIREKVFSFWDNCIWIGIVKVSLLRTGYFSLTVNVLRNCPQNWHANKRDIFQLNWLDRGQWMC